MSGDSKAVFLHGDDFPDLSHRDVHVGLFKQSVLGFASEPCVLGRGCADAAVAILLISVDFSQCNVCVGSSKQTMFLEEHLTRCSSSSSSNQAHSLLETVMQQG